MEIKCKVCGLSFPETEEVDEVECPSCNSNFEFNKKGVLELIRSGISFDKLNLILSFIFILAFFFLIYKSINNPELTLVEAGLIMAVTPLAGLLRNFIFIQTDKKYLLGLYYALFTGKLNYFDIGSKSLTYVIVTIQLLGLSILLFSSLYK